MGEKHLPGGRVSFLEAVFPSAGVELLLLMVFSLKTKLLKLTAFSSQETFKLVPHHIDFIPYIQSKSTIFQFKSFGFV